MGWTFEWRRTWDEVFEPSFVERWDALRQADASTTVYHQPGLVRAWVETCGAAERCEPLFGIASRDGVTILLPWIVVTHRGRMMTRRSIESVGRDMFGYHDPIVAGDANAVDWPQLWEEARSATATFAHQALVRSVRAGREGASVIPAEPAPVLRIGRVRSFDDLLAACSSNHRGDVQRRMRRLAERGEISLRVAGDAATSAPAFDRLSVAYEDRRSAHPEYPSLDRPGLRDFLRRVATEGVAEGWGHLSVLAVGSEAVAWHLGLFDRDELYWWVPAHARAFEPLSPGKVLLASLVRHAVEAKWRAMHFLTGAQPYKLAWRPDVPARSTVRWHAPTLVGAALRRYDRTAAL